MPERRNTELDVEADRRARQLVAEREIDTLKEGQESIREVLEDVRSQVGALRESLAVHKVQTGFIGMFVAAVVSAVAAIVQHILKGSH